MASLAVCRPLAYYAYNAVQDTYFVESFENLFSTMPFKNIQLISFLFINTKYSIFQYSRFCKKVPKKRV